MANSLERTYGIILYQEQVQQLAVELAGFTKMESDNFRKGIWRNYLG
jgi:error-prone DNA polymerase